MAEIYAQVILKTTDGIPANFITNTLSFRADSPSAAATDLVAPIKGFYDDISSWLGSAITKNGHEIKFYDRAGGVPNYPFRMVTFDLTTAPAGNTLPREVALVLSFQADRTAGLDQARRRGRIYIGPLDSGALQADARPSAAFVGDLTTAATDFLVAVLALAGPVEWVVWSTVNGSSSIVVDGWVDNAWDTQRRRGNEASTRTTWTTP